MVDEVSGTESTDNLAALRQEVAELRAAVGKQASGKDFWDKIGPFSTLFSSVVLGAAGLVATHFFNQNELRLKEADHQRELLRLERESADKARLEQTQALDKFLHYIASDKPAEREFGYAMFAAFGQASLALKLISLQQDQAGAQVAATLRNDPNETVRNAARQTLLTLNQARSIRAILKAREGGFYRSSADIGYGLWSLRGGSLGTVLHAYAQTGEKARGAVAAYLDRVDRQDPGLAQDDAFASMLRTAFADPAMQNVEDSLIDAQYLNPALKLAERVGLKRALSVAVLFDTIVMEGPGAADRITRQTMAALPGTPGQDVDEKAWTARFLALRRAALEDRATRAGGGALLQNWLRRVATYEALVKQGDWDLASATVTTDAN